MSMAATRDFETFWRQVYLVEHRNPANVALHVAGTVAGVALVPLALAAGTWWLLLFWPLIHAGPGLVGHRLFERDPAVGDLRVTRSDWPRWWFIRANHRLTLALLAGRRPWTEGASLP